MELSHSSNTGSQCRRSLHGLSAVATDHGLFGDTRFTCNSAPTVLRRKMSEFPRNFPSVAVFKAARAKKFLAVSLCTTMTAGMFLDYANGTGPTDPELPCLQASVEQTSRPHSLGTINAGQGIRCGVQISSQSVQNNRAGFSAVRSLGILCRTRSPTTRLTASRRRQRCGEDAVACGLPLNDIHLIHSRVGYIAGRAWLNLNARIFARTCHEPIPPVC